MISYQSLKITTTVLETGEILDCLFNQCSTSSFFDLHAFRSIVILEDKPFMRQAKLQFRDQASTFYTETIGKERVHHLIWSNGIIAQEKT